MLVGALRGFWEPGNRMNADDRTHDALMARNTLIDLPPEEALKHIALLVDASCDRMREDGLEKALKHIAAFNLETLTPAQTFDVNYFAANAWAGLRKIRMLTKKDQYHWEDECVANEVLQLRKALVWRGNATQHRVCQALTNLANLMNHLGRPVDAFGYWGEALALEPAFAMARGNRGVGLSFYARWITSQQQQHIIWKYAYDELGRSMEGRLEGDAKAWFERIRVKIGQALSPACLMREIDWGVFSAERSAEETAYRKWCLRHKLFLNPLNDLGAHPVAASDTLVMPGMVVKLDEDMRHTALMNQMKQEYVSARFFLYEGRTAEHPHFSDRAVLLYNTLDYPSYSLSTERVKAAFRILYSLFDKVAFFLNDYLRLKIPHKQVSFRRLWYNAQQHKQGLRKDITERDNWGLHGLFWLGKDLFENVPGFEVVMEPEARALAYVRNQLEHQYLKLHQDLWMGPGQEAPWVTDSLACSMYRHELEAKTVKLAQLVRSVLTCLCIAVSQEEDSKARLRKTDKKILPVFMDLWKDDWKL